MKRAKRNNICREIRQMMVSGEYKPGDRLPTREEFVARFETTPVTIQRVFDILVDEGFVVAHKPQGTFVAPKPPYLSNIVLLLPYEGYGPGISQYHLALTHEAERISQETGKHVNALAWMAGHEGIPEYMKLVDDANESRLAGLIMPHGAANWCSSPLLECKDLPRVLVLPKPRTQASLPEGWATIYLDYEDLVGKAFDWLQQQGRRRIAMLGIGTQATDMQDWLSQELSKRGMETRPYWQQMVYGGGVGTARDVMHLMMHSGQNEYPDGLLVLDDNLLPYGTQGIVDAGFDMDGRLDVVSHANLPWPTPSAVPVKRIGYDVHRVLECGLDLIERQRLKQDGPQAVTLTPQWEA